VFGAGCGPVEDIVFEPLRLETGGAPIVLREGAGAVDIPLRLASAPEQAVSASVSVRELEAQTGCQDPDFLSAEARVSFAPGQREALVALWIGDDELAELDEAFALELEDVQGATLLGDAEIRVVIEDDDRTSIVEARAFGVAPGAGVDASGALQAALDEASAWGRGVVRVEAGDYELIGVSVHPGTSLSGRGARFFRPASTPDPITLRVEHDGDDDSAPALIEGLTLDGRRDTQGAYQDDELADSHLIGLFGGAFAAGRLRVALETLDLRNGTGSGVFLGPDVDATLCRIRADDLHRDAVTQRGGGTRVNLRELSASATSGTTGLWFDGQPEGYGGTHRIDVTITDTQLASGDLEIEAYESSRVVLTRFSMTRGPLRLQAPDASVIIDESVLQSGLPSSVHNYFGLPHDVTVTRSTLVASETDENGLVAAPADRSFAAASARWVLEADPLRPPLLPAAPGPHRLTFDGCLFLDAAGEPAGDSVYAVESSGAGGSVVVRAPTLGPGLAGALAPACSGCSLEP
jgi:hypothetical protein